MSSADGGAFVNSGTYGCVFNPPIKCYRKKSTATLTDAAGKLFDDDKAFKDEYNELKRIQKLDPTHEFTVPYIGHCKVHRKDFSPSDETDKCIRHISPSRDKYTQMIYKFGGIDLNKYYKSPSKTFIYFEDLIGLFLPLMEGIQRMVAKRVAHIDIKPENILLDVSVPKIYLIDFGLITPFNMIKYETHFLDHEYPYYPPEFKVLSLLESGNYSVTAAMDVFLMNFRFYNQSVFVKWVTSKWPNYLNELKRFFKQFTTSTLGNTQKIFEESYVDTIDSYGLAMTMIEVLYRLMSAKQIVLKNSSKDFLNPLLTQVLFPMIHPDPLKRMTVDTAVPMLKKLLKDVSPPPTTAPAPPASPVVAPTPGIPRKPSEPRKTTSSEAAPSAPRPPLSLTKCLNLKLKEIQEFLRKFKLPVYGTKQAACKRLMDYLKTQPPYAKP